MPSDIYRLSAACLLGALIGTLALTPVVHATGWSGNDNAEFQTNSNPFPHWMAIEADLQIGLGWSSSPPNGLISLQYNPDAIYSTTMQFGADWFQAGIVSDSAGCATFSIQIYDTLFTEPEPTLFDWSTSSSGGCDRGILTNGAIWYIEEDMNANRISQVFFQMNPSSLFGDILYAPTLNGGPYYTWLRSNVCWCGTDFGSTSFTVGAGVLNYESDSSLEVITSPIAIGTAENSNMPYGLFSNIYSTHMYQPFGWPQTSGGGGCGNCHTCCPTSIISPNKLQMIGRPR